MPDDKVSVEGGESNEKGGESVKESEELVKERKQMEAETRMRRRSFKVLEEEKVVVPFPMLIKVEKNEKKPVLDLMEAIRQVKVCSFGFSVLLS